MMMTTERIGAYLENLSLLMQESAEHGDMAPAVYADVLELMGWLAAQVKGGTAA